jgi:hypothetical protein
MVARHQRLAAPDRQHLPALQGRRKASDVAPQTGPTVKPRATEGNCFRNLHLIPVFAQLFIRTIKSDAFLPPSISSPPQLRNLRANNDNSPQH